MTYCPLMTQTLRIISVRYIPPPLRLRPKTRRRATLLLPTWIYSCESVGTVNFAHPFYNKRDDFNFHITNFLFLSSNIPSSPAYGVFISHLIRYTRACSSYGCFILRAAQLPNKLFGQGYAKKRLKSPLGSSMVGTGILPNNMRSPSPEYYTISLIKPSRPTVWQSSVD